MKRMFLAAMAVALLFGACKDDNDQEVIDEEIITPPEKIICSLPAAIVGDLPDVNFLTGGDFEGRFANRQGAVDASTKVVVIHDNTVPALTPAQIETIRAAYDGGGRIVIVEPIFASVETLAGEMGHRHSAVRPNDFDRHFVDFYAFDNRNTSYHLLDVHRPGDTKELSEDDYVRIINPFIAWLNELNASTKAAPVRLTAADDDRLNIAEEMEAQCTSIQYSVGIGSVKVSNTHNVDINRSSHVVSTVNIWPFHAFDDQSSPGDYYVVNQQVTIPNGDWYQGNNLKFSSGPGHHGGAFANHFEISNTCAVNGTGDFSGFQASTLQPSPETVNGVNSYTSGYSWNIGGSLTAKLASQSGTTPSGPTSGTSKGIGATLTGGVTFANSKTWSVSNVSVYFQGDGQKTTAWKLSYAPLPQWKIGYRITDPVSAAVNTQMLYADWIWYVPKTNGFGDGDTDGKIALQTSINGSVWTCAYVVANVFHLADYTVKDENVQDYQVSIIPPPRVPTGKLALVNRETSDYVSEVKIYYDDTRDYYTINSNSIAPGDQDFLWLPIGYYSDISLKIGSHLYSLSGKIEIKRGETFTLNVSSTSPDLRLAE
jgi:hypothetical protein